MMINHKLDTQLTAEAAEQSSDTGNSTHQELVSISRIQKCVEISTGRRA